MAYTLIFLLKNVSSIYKSYSHFFSKNTCELDIVLTRIVNILTTNEFVKLTMLYNWALKSRWFYLFFYVYKKIVLNISFIGDDFSEMSGLLFLEKIEKKVGNLLFVNVAWNLLKVNKTLLKKVWSCCTKPFIYKAYILKVLLIGQKKNIDIFLISSREHTQ